MIDAPLLTKDCRKKVTELEADLRERLKEVPELKTKLQAEHAAAKQAGRFGGTFNEYCTEQFTQSAVAWVLGCVFVRFLEDNGLLEQHWIAGPGDRLRRARDQRELYFREHPTHSDRDYLEIAFRQVGVLPGVTALFAEQHNPLWHVPISGDAAGDLLKFFQVVEPDTGSLIRDFSDDEWETRFLGDLYEDLSVSAQKKYALKQTPDFVEEFILDLTLEPAVEEFGLAKTTLIDPTCGSGHFLLGAFERLLAKWERQEPSTNKRELAQRALAAVAGVDLNPFAVGIARFRLLIAALRHSEVQKLKDAPAFEMNLAVGDSLLHGSRFSREHAWGGVQGSLDPTEDPLQYVFEAEDAQELKRILGQQYSVVVGNPPYITVKDKALNQAYRQKYGSCHMKYSLGVPFTERFFDLGRSQEGSPAGFVGMITTNSFMKREFGRKLIEEYLPKLDLTHVLDTSGAYIPGHGTPTVILIGRNQRPAAQTIRTAMGIRGEPRTPEDPAQGKVWRSIVDLLGKPGAENDFVSVDDKERPLFASHPWSLQGGGAVELKTAIEAASDHCLRDRIESIGFMAITGEDEAYVATNAYWDRLAADQRGFGTGNVVRDWQASAAESVAFPYVDIAGKLRPQVLSENGRVFAHFWPLRQPLKNRLMFGKLPEESGLEWHEYRFFSEARYRSTLLIAFAFVATHNHFVLDRGGKVFNRSAPVIKLQPDATEEDHLELLGLLNSSMACFWMKQVFHCKGSTVDDKGARQTTVPFEDFYEYTSTGLQELPVCGSKPMGLTVGLDAAASDQKALSPPHLLELDPGNLCDAESKRLSYEAALRRCIALQEELDWVTYSAYNILEEDLSYHGEKLPEIELGERAFEIFLARRIASGEAETTWFARHGSTPTTEIPGHWPQDYRVLVERRIEAIESNRSLRLIEQPEFKRRWNTEPWDKQVENACRAWLLTRLEAESLWPRSTPGFLSCAQLADQVRGASDVHAVAEAYTGRTDFDLTKHVADLVAGDSVPSLAIQRFKASGLRKHQDWKETWELQRQEDEIDARTELPQDHPEHLSDVEAKVLKREQVRDIAVPPKYSTGDFASSVIWRSRGKLDVPKERFISLPGSEREGDDTLVVGWAGWNHLEQVKALASYYTDRKEQDGWAAERLAPLLTAIRERLFWVKMWHNDIDPEFGTRMGDTYEAFVASEAAALNLTVEQIDAWEPPAKRKSRTRRAKN